jgi:hypothetical protein
MIEMMCLCFRNWFSTDIKSKQIISIVDFLCRKLSGHYLPKAQGPEKEFLQGILPDFLFVSFFLAVRGFEFRASSLWGKCYSAWATPPALGGFFFVCLFLFFETASHYVANTSLKCSSFCLSLLRTGITDVNHHTQRNSTRLSKTRSLHI